MRQIHIAGGKKFGGNTREDFDLLPQPCWFEMDFTLTDEGDLIGGHNDDSYSGLFISEMEREDYAAAVTAKGGHAITLDEVLERMDPSSKLFMDLKDTRAHRFGSAGAVEAALEAIEKMPRAVVIMAYARTLKDVYRPAPGVEWCVKLRKSSSPAEYQEAIEVAARLGVQLLCGPLPSSETGIIKACAEAGIELIVPLGGKPGLQEIAAHRLLGTRMFICGYSAVVWERVVNPPPPKPPKPPKPVKPPKPIKLPKPPKPERPPKPEKPIKIPHPEPVKRPPAKPHPPAMSFLRRVLKFFVPAGRSG